MMSEEQKEENPVTPEGGNNPAPTDKVERAELAVEKLEAIEKRLDEKTAHLQELEARRILGGKTAGADQEQSKEETPQEYAQRILKNG